MKRWADLDRWVKVSSIVGSVLVPILVATVVPLLFSKNTSSVSGGRKPVPEHRSPTPSKSIPDSSLVQPSPSFMDPSSPLGPSSSNPDRSRSKGSNSGTGGTGGTGSGGTGGTGSGDPGLMPPAPNTLYCTSPGTVAEHRAVTLTSSPQFSSVDIDYWRAIGDQSGDLNMDQDGIYRQKGAWLAIIPDTPEATYGTSCSPSLSWVPRIHFADLRVGGQLYARSSTGRYAKMRVTSLPSETAAGEFIFDGTVWYGP